MQYGKCRECMIAHVVARQRNRTLARGAAKAKSPTYGLQKMNFEIGGTKHFFGRYSTALPLLSKTPENAGCKKRNSCDTDNGWPCGRIKHIGHAQTNNG